MINKFKYMALLFCFLTLSTMIQASVVENITGELTVSPLGGANYSLPIAVPKGVNGIQPELSIDYAAGTSSSVLGGGFSLSAIQSITRCTSSKKDEGYFAGIEVSENSRFCLNGSKLVLYSGTNAANGAEYREKYSPNVRVRAVAGSNYTPSSWIVETPDGYAYYYEKSPIFSDLNSEWLLSKKEDVFGNSIEYSYDEDKGYLSHIKYSEISVNFYYQDTRVLPKRGYSSGSAMSIEKLLSSIELVHNGRKYWTYRFDYIAQNNTDMLSKIFKCYGDNQSDCTNPLTFEYKDVNEIPTYWDDLDSRITVIDPQHYPEGNDYISKPAYSAVDINNNGYPEFCFYKVDHGVQCAGYSNGQYSSPVTVSDHVDWLFDNKADDYSIFSRLMFADLNGDHFPDLCMADDVGVKCSLNNEGTFAVPSYWNTQLNKESAFTLENLDNDTKPEFCGYTKETNIFTCYQNTGAAANTVKHQFSDAIQHVKTYEWQEIEHYAGRAGGSRIHSHKNEVGYITPFFIDIDGDLDRDLCWGATDQTLKCKIAQWDASGAQWLPSNYSNSTIFDYLPEEPVIESGHYSSAMSDDLNDHIEDLKDALKVMRATYRPVDLNSDGLIDTCYSRNNNYYCRLNTGAGTTPEQLWSTLAELPVDTAGDEAGNISLVHLSAISFQDVNADGLLDLCVIDTERRSCANNNGQSFEEFNPIQQISPSFDVQSVKTSVYNNAVQESFNMRTRYSFHAMQATYGTVINTTDINGNGLDEYCYRSSFGVICVDNDPYGVTGVLTKVIDSFGRETEIEYGAILSDGLADSTYGVPSGATKILNNGQKVSAIVSDSPAKVTGIVQRNRVEYRYGHTVQLENGAKAITHRVTINPKRKFKTVEKYSIDADLNGRLESIESYIDGIRTSTKKNSYSVVDGPVSGTKFIRLKETSDKQNDIIGSLVSTTIKQFKTWDDYNFSQENYVKKWQGGQYLETKSVTAFEHDSNAWLLGRPTQVTTTHSSGDGDQISKTVSYGYDDGKLIQEIIEPAEEHSLTIGLDYYPNGLVKTRSITGNNKTRSTITTYDALGRKSSVMNALGQVETYTYDGLCGISSTQLISGLFNYNRYDNNCRPYKAYNNSDSNVSETSISFVSPLNDNRANLSGVQETNDALYQIVTTAAAGAQTIKYLDAWGNTVRTAVKQHAGDEYTRFSVVDSIYDRYGRKIAQSLPYIEDNGRPVLSQWVTLAYDMLDRVKSETKPGSSGTFRTTHYSYNRTTTTMTSGQYSKVTTVGIHGKPITISENNETVSYGYDPMGNLVYTNQAGLETVLEYDAFGRKSKQSDPSMGIWQYKHNAFGELIWQQDANGTVVEYGYDELGRKHSETTSGDAITWVFNSSGNGIGQLHSVSRSQDGVTRIYRYDALGRVDAETLNVSGKSYQVTYAYDAFSRQSTASYPDDIEIFRSYDSVGQVHSVEMPTEDYLDYNYEIVRTEFKAVIEERIKYENLVRTLSAQVAHHEAKWQAYLAKIKELEELKILAEGEVGDLESIAQQHGIIAAYYLGKVTETQTRLANSSNSRIGWQGIVDGKHYFRRKWCSSRNVFGCRKRKERKDWFEVGELNLWHTMDVAGEIKSQYKDSVQWVQEFHKRGRWAPTVVVQRVLNLWNGLHTRALKNQALAQAKIDSPAATSRIYVEEPYTEDSWVIIANGSINIPIPVVLDKVRMVWKSVTVDEEIEHYETEIPKYQTLAANEKLVRDNKNVELTEGRTDLITASQTEEAFEKSFGFESIDEVDGVISERQNLESEHDRLVVWMALARNSAGQLQSELFGNGVVTWREFDDHDLSLTQIKSGTYSGYTLRQLEYDYDSQGRIVSKEDTQNGSQQFEIYEYDDQDRIDYWSFAQTKGDGATYTTQRSYDYDDHGNIIYKSNAGYMDIDSYSNRLTSRTHNSVTSQYHYDGNGNMKSGDGRNYTWNYFNKIAQVSKGGASVAYSYDGFGNRASQVNEAGDRTYYVGSGYEVTVQQAGSSTIELHRHNILVGDDVVATYERRIEDGEHDKDQAAYYHRDIIGSGDIVTSSNMSIISQRFYSPYGEEISLTVGEQQYANDQQLQIYKDEIVKVETVKKDQLLEQLIGLKVSHAPGLYPQQRSSTKCNWLGNCTTRRTFVFPQLTREYLNSMPFQQWDRIYLQSNTYLHVDIRGLINEWHDLKRVLQDYEVELKRTVGNDNSANVEAIDDGYIDEVRREVSMDDDATLVSEALTRNGGFAGTLRGYTSHEELRSIGLVNMNARHYDAFTGRFISADTMIPEADKPASYNRYAYVYGNPISMRDPSGHFSISLADTASVIGMSAHIFFNGLISLPYMFDSPQLQLAATVAYSAVGGAAMSGALVTNGLVASKTVAVMISAGTVSLGMSAAQSGKIDGVAVRNAAWAAASAGASYEIGHGLGKNWQDPTQYLAHGTVQGAISWAQGGSFIQGAVAGLAGHATGDLVGGYGGNNPAHIAARTTIAASLGYLSAEATGGDGARAAIAAASVHLYNYEGAQKDAKPSLVKGVKVYRKDIDIGGEDKYGHWWIEIDGKESYGWWPKEPVDLKGTLLGVDGELNGQTNFGGTATLDPHHGDRSSGVNVFDVYSTQPRDTVIQSIRSFSNSYSGSWSWPIGQNCHSFQDALLDNHGMTIRSAP